MASAVGTARGQRFDSARAAMRGLEGVKNGVGC